MMRPLIARSDAAKIRRKLMKTRGSKKAEGLDAFFFIEFFYRTDPPQRPSDIRRNRPVKSCRRLGSRAWRGRSFGGFFSFPGRVIRRLLQTFRIGFQTLGVRCARRADGGLLGLF